MFPNNYEMTHEEEDASDQVWAEMAEEENIDYWDGIPDEDRAPWGRKGPWNGTNFSNEALAGMGRKPPKKFRPAIPA